MIVGTWPFSNPFAVHICWWLKSRDHQQLSAIQIVILQSLHFFLLFPGWAGCRGGPGPYAPTPPIPPYLPFSLSPPARKVSRRLVSRSWTEEQLQYAAIDYALESPRDDKCVSSFSRSVTCVRLNICELILALSAVLVQNRMNSSDSFAQCEDRARMSSVIMCNALRDTCYAHLHRPKIGFCIVSC